METFADNAGGVDLWRGSKHDDEMVNAVIGVMAEAIQGSLKGDLNPFRAHIGEILLSNLERNFSGFFW